MNKKRLIIISFLLTLFLIPILAQPVFGAAIELDNPFGTKDLPTIVGGILRYVLGMIGIAVVVMFIIGGVTWMTSAGNAEKVKKGKDTLFWAVVGLIFIFFSYALVEFILKALVQNQG